MITSSVLQKLFPATDKALLATYAEIFAEKLPEYGINNRKREACFVAITGHETGGYKVVSENLNYSAAGLLATFPKYFDAKSAALYARLPQKIANRVYANRMSNGPEASGDGWKFRGRGIIQVTGRANYTAFAKWMKISLDEAVTYLTTPEGAVMGAIWFWTVAGLNELADADRITDITRKVNGGLIGLDHRKELWKSALALL